MKFKILKTHYNTFRPFTSSKTAFSSLKLSSLPLFGLIPTRLIDEPRTVYSPGKTYVQQTKADTYEVRRSPDSTYTTHDYYIEFSPTATASDPTLARLAGEYLATFDSEFRIIEARYIPASAEEFLKLYGKSPLSKPMRIFAFLFPLIFFFLIAVLTVADSAMKALGGGEGLAIMADETALYPWIAGMLLLMFTALLLPIFLNASFQKKHYQKLNLSQKKSVKKQYKRYVYRHCKGARLNVILETLEYLNRYSGESVF